MCPLLDLATGWEEAERSLLVPTATVFLLCLNRACWVSGYTGPLGLALSSGLKPPWPDSPKRACARWSLRTEHEQRAVSRATLLAGETRWSVGFLERWVGLCFVKRCFKGGSSLVGKRETLRYSLWLPQRPCLAFIFLIEPLEKCLFGKWVAFGGSLL